MHIYGIILSYGSQVIEIIEPVCSLERALPKAGNLKAINRCRLAGLEYTGTLRWPAPVLGVAQLRWSRGLPE